MTQPKKFVCLQVWTCASVALILIIGSYQTYNGGAILWENSYFVDIAKNHFQFLYITSLSLGIMTQIICFIGWYSVIKKQSKFLQLLTVSLIIMIAVECLSSVWAFRLQKTVVLKKEFTLDIKHSFESFKSELTQLPIKYEDKWNKFQEQFQCCGIYGLNDYKVTKVSGIIPYSCCSNLNDSFVVDCKGINQRGCLHYIELTIKKILSNIGHTALVAATNMIFAILFLYYLIISLKNSSKKQVVGEPVDDNVIDDIEQNPPQIEQMNNTTNFNM